MEEMKDRIITLRKMKGLTQKEFAERIGVKRGTLSNYELGRNIPVESVRMMICREYGVKREWLETGQGEMFEEKSKYDLVLEMSEEHLKNENEAFRRRLISVISELPEEHLALVAAYAKRIVGD